MECGLCAEPLPEEEIQDLVHKNFRMYSDEPEPPRAVLSSSKSPEYTDEIKELDKSLAAAPLPKYPLDVWEGTLYMDFARRAQQGNFVPLEFFIEGAMTYAGAVAGRRLCGLNEDITPRLYTVLIALAGIGKGSCFRRIRRLFQPSTGRMARIFLDKREEDMPPECSVLINSAASENGVNDALLKHSRVLQEFEEIDSFMGKTEIKGNNALMAVVRTCFDDIEPRITTSSQRPVAASCAYLSLMGATTPSLWRKMMEGRDSYGSGLGGRFNLVATNETRTTATLTPLNVADLQGVLERKFAELESDALTISTEGEALDVLADWWEQSRGKTHFNRVNVIAHRKALHLAWMRNQRVINTEVMRDALRLADYLVAVRDAFAVVKGEDKTAINENRVMHVLEQVAPLAVRLSQLVELLDGIMGRSTIYRSLEALVSSGEAEKYTKKEGGRPYAVYRACSI